MDGAGNGGSGTDGELNGASHKRRSSRQPHITWDEETIAEHNKLRGTRQKIDEPSTPYHYQSASSEASDNESAEDSGSGGSALGSTSGVSFDGAQGTRTMQDMMSEVHMRLPAENDLRRERATRWQSDLSDSDCPKEDQERSRQFKQMRSRHYNEYQALQQWRRRHSSGTDADDEGDDRNGDNGRMSNNPVLDAAAVGEVGDAPGANGNHVVQLQNGWHRHGVHAAAAHDPMVEDTAGGANANGAVLGRRSGGPADENGH